MEEARFGKEARCKAQNTSTRRAAKRAAKWAASEGDRGSLGEQVACLARADYKQF